MDYATNRTTTFSSFKGQAMVLPERRVRETNKQKKKEIGSVHVLYLMCLKEYLSLDHFVPAFMCVDSV